MDKCEAHGLQICSRCIVVTDAARRMADAINTKLTTHNHFELHTQWMAFKLHDGTTDGVLYNSRLDAITHQLDERFCCYFSVRNALQGVNPKDCQIFLDMNRAAYDAGMRLSEPQAPQLIIPSAYYDRLTGRWRPQGKRDG